MLGKDAALELDLAHRVEARIGRVAEGPDRREDAFCIGPEDEAHQVEEMDAGIEEGTALLPLARPWALPDDVVGKERAPVEHAHPADRAIGNQLARPRNRAAKTLRLDDLEANACPFAGLDHRRAVGDTGRHRLFDEDVLARRGCSNHLVAMCGVWRCDQHRIDVRPRQERLVAGLEGGAVILRQLLGPASARDRHELRPTHMLGDALRMGPAHIARPQDGDPQFGHSFPPD